MKKTFRKLSTFLAVLLSLTVLLSLVGCGTAAPAGNAETSAAEAENAETSAAEAETSEQTSGAKYINVAITNDPSTVNPLTVNNVGGSTLTRLLYLPLEELDDELNFVDRLAESITTEDNTTFTIKLRENIKWSDGEPVTVDDVIFTLALISNPEVGAREPSTYNAIVGTDDAGLTEDGAAAEGIKKVDDYTFTIETKYPVTLDIFKLTIGTNLRTLPKHILENIEASAINTSQELLNPSVTNGAYLFKEYIPSQSLTFTANPDYYLGKPIIDTLNIKILTSTQIAAQLESGEVDLNWPLVGNLDYSDYDRIRNLENLHTVEGIASNVQTLFINSESIDNVKVRQAISLAIDREGILENLLNGDGYITKTPVTNQIQYWNEEAAKPEYDLEKAKQLLAESGWDLSKEIVFSVPTGNTTREKAALIITESLKSIGLNVVIEKADLATTLANVQKCTYDISIIGMPDVPLNIVRYLRVYASTAYTWTNYSNPTADELVNTIQTNVDPEIIEQAYLDLQQLIADEVPVAGIYSEYSLHGLSNRIVYGELKEYGAFLDVEKWDVK